MSEDQTEPLLRCPGCGNVGEADGAWTGTAPVPFRIVERVLRSWRFTPMHSEGRTRLLADAGLDEIDWESGDGERIERVQKREGSGPRFSVLLPAVYQS